VNFKGIGTTGWETGIVEMHIICSAIICCSGTDTCGQYWLLSSALPEDREIRQAIQKEKLVVALRFHYAEISM